MSATTIYVMLQVLNSMKVLYAPYLPFSSQKLHELLGYSGDVSQCRWEAVTLPHGRALPAPTPLFRKLDPPVASDG
jgi:methionyl-tRNA synthetase